MLDGIRRVYESWIARAVRVLRTAANLVLAIVFLLVAGYATIEVGPDIYDFVTGCGTELCCEECETISVDRIIDGDTFVSAGGRVRTYGYDSPEVGEPCADESTERLRDLAGDAVRMEHGPRTRDSYGRMLAYIYTASGDSIDERMVREGLARAWTADGQHVERLMSLEREAQSKGIGCLW